VDADVVLTVGTDCSVGKMTASLEIVAAARERGIDAAFVPTGQTGIMIAGWGTRSTASSPTSPPARLRTCSSRSATTTTSSSSRAGQHHPPRLLGGHLRHPPRLDG